jgi:DNA-binding MltR family transcriptional regulator
MDDAEFLSAKPSENIKLPQVLFTALCQTSQNFVASGMSKSIVDLLKEVNVENSYDERRTNMSVPLHL